MATGVRVCNIVVVGKVSGVDFKEAKNKWSGESRTKRKKPRGPFNGAVIRLSNLCTCLLFPNGAVTAVGVKSFHVFPKIMSKLCSILPPSDVNCSVKCIKEFRLCNIVASMSIASSVNIHALYGQLSDNYLLMFDPENFPGMTVSLPKGRGGLSKEITVIVFHSGKVILTGARDMSDIHRSAVIVRQEFV